MTAVLPIQRAGLDGDAVADAMAAALHAVADDLDPRSAGLVPAEYSDDLRAALVTARMAVGLVRQKRGLVRALRFAARYLHAIRNAPDCEVAAAARGIAEALARFEVIS